MAGLPVRLFTNPSRVARMPDVPQERGGLLLRPTTLGPLLVLVAAFVAIGGAPVSAEELVGDGGFGDGVGDWTTIDGELSLVPAAHSGSQAVQLSGAGAFDAEMFQLIPVADGETYEWSGWASADPQSISQGRLRVSWVGSSGSVTSLDEVTWQPWAVDAYQHFSTGPRIAPPGTTAARVSVLVAAVSFPSSVLVDDVSFEGPRPAPPTPTMSPTETPTPPPPTAPPATASPTPGGAPTASPSHAPTPTEAPPAPTAAPTSRIRATGHDGANSRRCGRLLAADERRLRGRWSRGCPARLAKDRRHHGERFLARPFRQPGTLANVRDDRHEVGLSDGAGVCRSVLRREAHSPATRTPALRRCSSASPSTRVRTAAGRRFRPPTPALCSTQRLRRFAP